MYIHKNSLEGLKHCLKFEVFNYINLQFILEINVEVYDYFRQDREDQ